MHTYFLESADRQYVKIGRSINVKKRIRSMMTGSHAELKLIGKVDSDIERSMHREFAALRVRGEWFRIEGALLEYLKREFHYRPAWVKVPRQLLDVQSQRANRIQEAFMALQGMYELPVLKPVSLEELDGGSDLLLEDLLTWSFETDLDEPPEDGADEDDDEDQWLYHDGFIHCVERYLVEHHALWLGWMRRPQPDPLLVLIMRWPTVPRAQQQFVRSVAEFALRFGLYSDGSFSNVYGYVHPVNLVDPEELLLPEWDLDCTLEAMVFAGEIALTPAQLAEICERGSKESSAGTGGAGTA